MIITEEGQQAGMRLARRSMFAAQAPFICRSSGCRACRYGNSVLLIAFRRPTVGARRRRPIFAAVATAIPSGLSLPAHGRFATPWRQYCVPLAGHVSRRLMYCCYIDISMPPREPPALPPAAAVNYVEVTRRRLP